MPREAHGTIFVSDGAVYASVTIAPRKRLARALRFLAVDDTDAAHAWAGTLQSLVTALRKAGRDPEIVSKIDLALEVGRDNPTDGLERVRRGVAKLDGHERERALTLTPSTSKGVTFKAFGQRWTKGDLHREYPDHVTKKKTADKDAGALDLHVYPHVGHIALRDFNLEHAQGVLRHVPPERSSAVRRQVAQLMVRVCNLAVYPAQVLDRSPLPKGFLPRVRVRPGTYLYPDEDAKLLGCTDVPIANRLLYGFLAREGMRREEALALAWTDLDLDRGAVRLDVNKTDDPRAWALDPSTVKALVWWRKRVPNDAPVFASVVDPGHLADSLRDHLRAADVKRPELFEHNETRRQLNVHSLRATFVTISLANGRTEAWVQDRTGHRSSAMVNRYRRVARTAAELGLGPLKPLDTALAKKAKKRT